MEDSPLRNDVPQMQATHKYELGQAMDVGRGGKAVGLKFRWTCTCGAKGEWCGTAGMTHSGWTEHIEESARANRAALYGDESNG